MTPIFTYHPTRPCGRSSTFRRTCTNSFTIGSCAASECEVNPPSTICVAPQTGYSCALQDCGTDIALIVRDFSFADGATVFALYPGTDAALRAILDGDYLLLGDDLTECQWSGETAAFYGDDQDYIGDCGVISTHRRYRYLLTATMSLLGLGPSLTLTVTYQLFSEIIAATTDGCYAEDEVITTSSGSVQTGNVDIFVGGETTQPCAGDDVEIAGWGELTAPVTVSLVEAP